MVVQGIFLFSLAAMIHLVLLSTNKYNWFDGPRVKQPAAASAQNAPMPSNTAQAKS
jgi:light-harvesting complex 1 alpha chain